MARRKIILDCDPGQDDAVMLMLALACPDKFDIVGITTVAGNAPLELTQRNARIVCDLAGDTSVPVFAGCEKPMRRELITMDNVHGKTGIEGIETFEPNTPLQHQHAVDFIVETLLGAEPESITLVPTGPLTNIGQAISRDPSILAGIREIVLMGGSTSPGAETNMLIDPEAAQLVLNCGRPLTIAPLDMTRQVPVTRNRIEQLRTLESDAGRAIVSMMEHPKRFENRKYGSEGAPLHDPCTIAYLLNPDLFEGKMCNVEVETGSPVTLGHTTVDFEGVAGLASNAFWLHQVNADGFFELLAERIK
jgi:purine nucleosidase